MHDLQFESFGRKTSWLTKACLKLRVFEDRKPVILQRLVEWKDFGTPPAKKLMSAAKKAKRRLRHPLRTLNTIVSGRSPAMAPGTILFLGFDHRYTGNSRALFEELLADRRFYGRDIRFATTDVRVPSHYRVRPESIAFTRMAERAEFVIAETWIPASVPKNPASTWVQLWHGTPIKRMLFDSHEREITMARPLHKVNKYKDIQRWDYFVVDGDIAARRFSTAFLLPQERLLVSEYPRVRRVRSRMTETSDEDVATSLTDFRWKVLYAPTWRDYNYGLSSEGREANYLMDLGVFASELGPEYAVVFNDHHYLPAANEIHGHPRVFKTSGVAAEELLPIVDVVVTDYSSIEFDARSLGLRVVLFRADLPKFTAARGIYTGDPFSSWGPEFRTPESAARAVRAEGCPSKASGPEEVSRIRELLVTRKSWKQ